MADIKVYALSYCPWCKKTRRFFDERHIAVEVVEYDLADKPEQDRIVAEIKALSGGDVTFPCTIIDGTAVLGHHPDRYIALLGLPE
ncbi:MAG: glutaredoxin family protein [Chloroflexi bacterium]|jgi:glutaredoxin|nr:glutaredoxin family protein [Chloroflexota bacterium]